MPSYCKILEWADLPPVPPAQARETYELDFKGFHQNDSDEQAKDMAAFANCLGGVILVGVAERADAFDRTMLTVQEARVAARSYEDAARDLLAPRPSVDAVILINPADSSRGLVAVNIDPFPGQLVAARLSRSDAWRFPVRVASRHTAYLNPEQAMIYSVPQARKAAILLASIPEQARKGVYVQMMERKESTDDVHCSEELYEAELVSVSAETNAVELRVKCGLDQPFPVCAPLEDVVAVWNSRGSWHIRVAGAIRHRTIGEGGGKSIFFMSGRGPTP